ncbi:hypothetical protein HAX54_035201 [Datura stramonium]|uniref:Uncharacterized protein n=1 Tax=Datura stramonium TaxID=4076 RepID=A0ABS8VHA9_DATST|nr:hypothetical protein [Datura stramonium]
MITSCVFNISFAFSGDDATRTCLEPYFRNIKAPYFCERWCKDLCGSEPRSFKLPIIGHGLGPGATVENTLGLRFVSGGQKGIITPRVSQTLPSSAKISEGAFPTELPKQKSTMKKLDLSSPSTSALLGEPSRDKTDETVTFPLAEEEDVSTTIDRKPD